MQQFHLIPAAALWLDGSAVASARSPEGLPLSPLSVPADVSYLVLQPDVGPVITRAVPLPPARWAMLEPVFGKRSQAWLLLSVPTGFRAHVNGQVATRLVVLKEKDQLQLDADWILHVTVFSRPRLGPPAPDRVGQPCLVCRVPLAAGATCYTCQCGKAFHCAEKDNGGLECARLLSECSACGRPVVLTEGFTYLPL
jgi:hypothetical protein